MNKILTLVVSVLILSYCSAPNIQKPAPQKEESRILATVVAVAVPVIEKKTRMVKVPVDCLRPSLDYSGDEVEISKIETGYEIKIWLVKKELLASSLAFKKEVVFHIQKSGGHDIEVVGKNRSFIDIVFIDEHD